MGIMSIEFRFWRRWSLQANFCMSKEDGPGDRTLITAPREEILWTASLFSFLHLASSGWGGEGVEERMSPDG